MLVCRGHGSKRRKNSGKSRVLEATREHIRGIMPAREMEPTREIKPVREIKPDMTMEVGFPANSTDVVSVSQIAHIITHFRIIPCSKEGDT